MVSLSKRTAEGTHHSTPPLFYSIFKHLARSWWVILFALICACIYERALNDQVEMYTRLQNKLHELVNEKSEALALQENLLQQINSQSDHDWIQLTLMKGLGLVPEGQTKVFFAPNDH